MQVYKITNLVNGKIYVGNGFSYPGERNSFYGKHHSETTKKTLREKCPRSGWKHSKESRERIRQAHIGKQFTEEHREHLSEAKKGHPVSEEQRQKISDFMKQVPRTDEWKAKISAALKGKPKSAAHRQALSKSRLKRNK